MAVSVFMRPSKAYWMLSKHQLRQAREGLSFWSETMIKAHRKFKEPTMRRSSRVYLNELNAGKAQTLKEFLYLCHDVTQYFVDLFWQRQDFSAELARAETIHRATERFGVTYRLAQALAKQAKECVRSTAKKKLKRKPQLRLHTTTLYSHFVTIESYQGEAFDFAVKVGGSGAPDVIVPCKSTAHLNQFINDGWALSKTIRLGRRGDKLFVDFILEKPKPPLKQTGAVVGMDSNYRAGFVFSDGQQVGQEIYARIQTFGKRQKHTHAEVKSMVGHALKQVDLSGVKLLAIENLKYVKHGKRGKFPRRFNRRLAHWLSTYTAGLQERDCEEQGVRLEKKSPWMTSRYCRICGKWDKRNRKGDSFLCVNCGHQDNADHNASKNLELLGLAGKYGLRSLQSPALCFN
jgi:hypothetical protein